ncbi:MAG: hypothetical protein GX142_02225 [Chloroflexi bacterium]|jgi:hypothetical protein|nr:hypothetical protein [Chloroflexota bacterium]
MLEKVRYGGWENCYRLYNSTTELIITGDVGPRIIRFGYIDEMNVLHEYPDQMGKTFGDQWLNFGGHRLWHAPEAQPRTYYPDREPVLIQEIEHSLVATQKPETSTGIQKQIEITLAPNKPEVYLTHRLINHNLWAIETAPWTISVMAPGGLAILPLPPRGSHPEFLVPTCTLSLWPYTDLSDQRFTLGAKYILIKQDPGIKKPQKLGLFTSMGWGAYINQGYLFVKQVPLLLDGIYPDMGTNFEVFTNDEMLELEALGPLETIPPKGQVELQERWTLFKDIPAIVTETDAEDVFANLLF